MKPSSGKAKGRKGERDVAAFFQAWWRQLEPGSVFMRTPGSGGWSNASATGLKTRGDLTVDPTTCNRWPFSVEVKHRKVITLGAVHRFENGKPSTLDDYWLQCFTAATKDELSPLLVFRGDKMDWRVVYLDQEHGRTLRLLATFLTYEPKWMLANAQRLDRSSRLAAHP